MTYDPDYSVQPSDLIDTGSIEQDDFNPEIAE